MSFFFQRSSNSPSRLLSVGLSSRDEIPVKKGPVQRIEEIQIKKVETLHLLSSWIKFSCNTPNLLFYV